MSKQATQPITTPKGPDPQSAESVEYVRTGRYREHEFAHPEKGPDPEADAERATRLQNLINALSAEAPWFLAEKPDINDPEDERYLAPVDHLREFATDLWPTREGVAEVLAALHALLRTEASVDLFSLIGQFPLGGHFANPRMGWRPGKTSEDSSGASEGHARYRCDFTREKFDLPLLAPVPALYVDSPMVPTPPSANAEDADVIYYTVHPALVEAGPTYVLHAAWAHAREELHEVLDRLLVVTQLAHTFSGVKPEDLKVEWPARAFRRWEKDGQSGKAPMPVRTLTGFRAPA